MQPRNYTEQIEVLGAIRKECHEVYTPSHFSSNVPGKMKTPRRQLAVIGNKKE
jgi:hypothetical protein